MAGESEQAGTDTDRLRESECDRARKPAGVDAIELASVDARPASAQSVRMVTSERW
jgi:hypothetical protein